MAGVAAGLSSRNNLIATSGTVLPKYLDFSFRDRTDASAKRRFQVKVPCRLMAILALVFLIVPGLVFLHREIHIHEDHYQYHFKQEHYVNVNTKDVWDNFRLVTTDDEAQEAPEIHDQEEAEIAQVEKNSAVGDSNAGTSDSSGPLVEELVAVPKKSKDHRTKPTEVDTNPQEAAEEENSVENGFQPSSEQHVDAATPTSADLTARVESPHTMNGDSDIDITKIQANSTATNNESKL